MYDKSNFLKDFYPLVLKIETNLKEGHEAMVYWDDDFTDIDPVSRVEMLRFHLITYRQTELDEECCEVYRENMKSFGGRDNPCYPYHKEQLYAWGDMIKSKHMADAESEYLGYLRDADESPFAFYIGKQTGSYNLCPNCNRYHWML